MGVGFDFWVLVVRLRNFIFDEIGRIIENVCVRGLKDESKVVKRLVWLLRYVGWIGGREIVLRKVLD